MAGGRPFGEFYFADEFRLHPRDVPTFAAGRWIAKRRFFNATLFKFGGDLLERLGSETCADATGVLQFIVLVIAEEQGSESDARAFGLRVTTNDELLLLDALYFEPTRRAGLLVRAVGPLGDDAFHLAAASVLQHAVALPLNVVAVT